MYTNHKSKRKNKLSKRSVLFLIGIAVAMTVLVIGLILLLSRGGDVEETLTPLPFTSNSKYFIAGNSIIYSDDNLLTCSDATPETVWQVSLYASNLDFVTRDNMIAIIGDNVIQIIDNDGNFISQTGMKDIIKSVRICRNKFAVHLMQQSDDEVSPSYIVIFNLDGEKLYEFEVTGRHILSYDFDAQSDLLYLLELDVTGTAPVCRISTYRAETQAMTGIKEIKDQLVSKLYIHEGTLYAIGTNRMSIFPPMNADEQKIMTYGWILHDASIDNVPRFIFIPSHNTVDNIDTIRIINPRGNEITVNLPPGVFRILHEEDKIYCFASDNIFVYTSNGEYLRTYPLPFKIDKVERAIERHVFITVGETVYLLPLP